MSAATAVLSLMLAASPPAATETVDYGLFGTLHVSRPAGAITHSVLLLSDREGWSARSQALAAALAGQGAFVIGVDTPFYIRRMETIGDACSYPAGHFEEVAHWIERREGLADYNVPLVVGDGFGATFAYALTAQAPAGTFEGLVTLGWDADVRFPKPICPGDAGAMTAAAEAGRVRVVAVPKLPVVWWPQPFAAGARIDGIGAGLQRGWQVATALVPPLRQPDALRSMAHTYDAWRRATDAAVATLPDDVADLPLTDLPATADASAPHRIAIIMTGDGGWAGLDRGVADALTAKGVRVIGFSTLKFFWQKQSAQAISAAIGRVIAHYGKADSDASFVLLGYSFGASLVPVVINRLPDALHRRVEAGVLISPDDEAVFEIHVGDWFGSTQHEGALPIGPEMGASTVTLLCVHGADEDDSFCARPQPPRVRVLQLPGGHHYDGDYPALGALIVRNLGPARP